MGRWFTIRLVGLDVNTTPQPHPLLSPSVQTHVREVEVARSRTNMLREEQAKERMRKWRLRRNLRSDDRAVGELRDTLKAIDAQEDQYEEGTASLPASAAAMHTRPGGCC